MIRTGAFDQIEAVLDGKDGGGGFFFCHRALVCLSTLAVQSCPIDRVSRTASQASVTIILLTFLFLYTPVRSNTSVTSAFTMPKRKSRQGVFQYTSL